MIVAEVEAVGLTKAAGGHDLALAAALLPYTEMFARQDRALTRQNKLLEKAARQSKKIRKLNNLVDALSASLAEQEAFRGGLGRGVLIDNVNGHRHPHDRPLEDPPPGWPG